LQQEISELRMAANELHVVRMLEAELNRLRTLRQTAAGQAVQAPTALLQAPPSGTSPQVTIRPAQTLVANPQQPILTAGSDALPEGLALPLGWTMMPLHRVDATGHPPAPGMSTSVSSPGNNQTTAAHARGSTAHAVFSPPSAPRQPEGTNNGLAGSSSTPNLSLGQARRRVGALDGSGNSTQSLVSEPITTTGDVVLPGLHSREVPRVTSSAATENSATTTNQNHADSTVTLPSLPAWDSGTPLPTPVPSQPSASAQNAGGSTVGEILGDGLVTRKNVPATAPSVNGTNHERSNGEDVASSSQDKGKAKVATVEDFTEDVD
jgi:E3 ubiquitin-protein ligase synoviolin